MVNSPLGCGVLPGQLKLSNFNLRNYGFGFAGALAFALLVNAWPPWERSWPTPAVVWQALKTGATPISATSVKARRKDLFIRYISFYPFRDNWADKPNIEMS
jgi:hypothetical protein